MSIYIARFTPEAWINDQAVETDALGEREWDCTTAVRAHADYFAGLSWEDHPLGLLDALDVNDVLKTDPEAPSWVRDWQGPCTIRVRKEPDPPIGDPDDLTDAQYQALSDLVHDVASQQASNIVNDGRSAMLEYLRDNGWTETEIFESIRQSALEAEEQG